jgi:hypothetical protein
VETPTPRKVAGISWTQYLHPALCGNRRISQCVEICFSTIAKSGDLQCCRGLGDTEASLCNYWGLDQEAQLVLPLKISQQGSYGKVDQEEAAPPTQGETCWFLIWGSCGRKRRRPGPVQCLIFLGAVLCCQMCLSSACLGICFGTTGGWALAVLDRLQLPQHLGMSNRAGVAEAPLCGCHCNVQRRQWTRWGRTSWQKYINNGAFK